MRSNPIMHAIGLIVVGLCCTHLCSANTTFRVELPRASTVDGFTGRIFVIVSRSPQGDHELLGENDAAIDVIGTGVKNRHTKDIIILNEDTPGTPVTVRNIPAGDYFIQAVARSFTEYRRADGHTLWALDQWEGQDGFHSAGTLYSPVRRVHIGGKQTRLAVCRLTGVMPGRKESQDTAWIKHIKIQSAILSRFWGRPIFLGADVLLPKGYQDNPTATYPVIYESRNHYVRDEPFSFSEVKHPLTSKDREGREQHGVETGFEFFAEWSSETFPRLIEVQIISPTPFYDFSALMNSSNNGPYDDAVMQELIPFLETQFRIKKTPDARVLLGKSSAGRDALGLMLHHPDFFAGAWIFYPWSFNYRSYFGVDIYKARNFFQVGQEDSQGFLESDSFGQPPERLSVRTTDGNPIRTKRQQALEELVIGGEGGVGAELSGSDNALNSPVGRDGYPAHLYDLKTGEIAPDVANYWHGHDLANYAEINWTWLGPKLRGKLHFFVGDMDQWQRNFGVHDFEQFFIGKKLDTCGATFIYGPMKGHGWQPMTNAELVRTIADYIAKRSPARDESPATISAHP